MKGRVTFKAKLEPSSPKKSVPGSRTASQRAARNEEHTKRDNGKMQVMFNLTFTSIQNLFIDYIECLKGILIF